MANTESQAEAIRDLLVEKLELFDATLDVSEGSALWAQVIAPIFDELGTDPFDTDIRTFLQDRIEQSFPSISAQEGDALVDLLITPLTVLLEPLKREIQIVRKGQSARNVDNLRLEDARDLAANFFIEWRGGNRASGMVRVYYAQPTFATILPTVEFSTADGVIFRPSAALTVRPEQMLLYRSGQDYYVDVPVTSSSTGTSNNIAKGSITSVKGISGYTRISNLSGFSGAADEETAAELLARTRSSLTERTLNVRRGIVARIESDFASVVDVEVVGYGDPEMNRDIITGRSKGSVVASGICIVVGQFVLMFSTFEDRGTDGTAAVAEGDEIELNFWKFLYDTDTSTSNEKFTVGTILFDSRNAITQMPSILLFRISDVPSVTQPIAGTLAGVLPGVFAVVRRTGVIEISDIPGGILNPDTARGTIEINDDEIHIGGHYDVWLRADSAGDSATFSAPRSTSSLVEGLDLVVSGESTTLRHMVHRLYTITSNHQFTLGSEVKVVETGAIATISRVTASSSGGRTYELWNMNGVEFAANDQLTDDDGVSSYSITAVSSQAWEDVGVTERMVLSLPRGNEEGAYRILKVEGSFLYTDIELTTTASGQAFRVLDEVSIDVFDPKSTLVPFADALGDDLRTTIGSTLLRTGINLQDYGVAVDDTLEILDGDDAGTYTIKSWSTTYGGSGPVVSAAMSATNSSITYTVYRTTQSMQRPFLRVKPGGVVLLDTSGQDSGYRVPYALPVLTLAKDAFSGSKAVAAGLNGFVLMDPGAGWAPTADYATDIEGFDWTAWTGAADDTPQATAFEEFYIAEKFKRCYTDACIEGAGYVAVISVHGSSGQMYLESNLPTSAQNFLQNARDWLLGVIASFNFGGDEEHLADAFHPLIFGPNADTALPLLLQFEIIIPFEVFDGCNNVFVALPEFDWENEFAAEDTFGDAIARFNDGAMSAKAPALLSARAGDVLTVLSGLNAGAYVVDSVQEYVLVNGRAIVDGGSGVNLDNAYRVALVVIRDEFPVPAFNGLSEFFAAGAPEWSLPSAPSFPFTVTNVDGDTVDGWEFVEQALTWFFQLLTSLGFDLPESVSLDVPETLKAFWQLLFNDYVVGRPTAAQYTRLYFQEPTSCTVYAPRVCGRYQWAMPVHVPITATGADFTLPIADIEGVTLSLEVNFLGGSTTLSGTATADMGAAATIGAFASLLQALLDPDEKTVIFSGPTTDAQTGALTITTVSGGVDTFLYVDADTLAHGFRWLGFYGSEGRKWAEVTSTGTFGYLARVTWPIVVVRPGLSLTITYADDSTESEDVHTTPASLVDQTYEQTAAELQTAIETTLTDEMDIPIVDAVVSVTFGLVDDAYVFTVSIMSSNVKAFTLDVPAGAYNDAFTRLFSASSTPLTVSGAISTTLTVTGEDVSSHCPAFNGSVTDDASTVTLPGTQPTYAEALACDTASASGDLNALAAELNAIEAARSVDSVRCLWFVGGSTLTARSVPGNTMASMSLTASEGEAFAALGFADPSTGTGVDASNTILEGTTTAPTTEVEYHHAHAPTLFTAVAGAAELLFVPSSEADDYQVFPGQTSDGDTPTTSLPRDLVVGSPYDGQNAGELAFTDTSYASPIELDVREASDVVHIYEQRVFLDFTASDVSDTNVLADRVIAVFTTFGSSTVSIPDFTESGDTNEFTFLAPGSGLDDDQVQLNDVLFLEEGDDAGGYTVIARSATTLTLDRSLLASTETVYQFGNDGVLVVDESDAKFTAATGTFTSDSIGRYLTIWACNHEDEDGSYKITAVESDGSGCTLDTDVFTHSESSVHWAIVKAPTETLGDSAISGRTALLGLRPVRVYSGTPGEFQVARVTNGLDRTAARIYVTEDADDTVPKQGVKQPYKVMRPGTQHISSTLMMNQRERGLFYFDVLTQSLGGDDLYNLPKDTRLEPVFGTYDSDGYRLDVDDSRYTFSTQEEANIVFSPTFLPAGLDDQDSNRVVIDGRNLRVDYEYAPVVAQVQGLLSSDTERVLCANALARHFLPSYVYFDLTYAGGNSTSTVATALKSYINGLSAIDNIDVSKLEKVLHQNSVTSYAHPVRVVTLTHDLDRRIVGTQSESSISDDDISYNGTNRTTFFISGSDASAYTDETSVPAGERIRLTKGVVPSTFR